jgi:hypothetical protein
MRCKIFKKPRSAEATNVHFGGNRPPREMIARLKKGLHPELADLPYLLAILICALPFTLLMLSVSALGEEPQNSVPPHLSHQPTHCSDNLRDEKGIDLTGGLFSRHMQSQIGPAEMFSGTEDSNKNYMEIPFSLLSVSL